jgi:hypothetical protein
MADSGAMRTSPLVTLAAMLAWSGTAQAQDAAPAASAEASRATVYEATFFAAFAPLNALDIVRRVPGFQLEETEGEVRGFSGTAGNVVLNGARPSSKAERLEAMLAKIPARRVLRVEVASGDLYGSDYAGKSQVLNVVLSQEGGIDGNVKASIARLHDGSVFPGLEASALIRRGSSSFNLSAGTGRDKDVEVGFDDITRASDGVRLELRDKVNTITNRDPFFSASWSNEGGTNQAAHLNLRYVPSRFSLFQTNHVTPATGPVRDDRLEQDYRNTAYELGGDLTRPLGGGALKLVVLGNRRDRDNFDSNYNRVAGETIGGFEQFQDARYDEVLGRLNWSHPKVAGFSTEIGSELAYNKLENATELFLIGPGGVRTRIDLPIDRATVDEIRTETYLNLGRPLTSTLRLDTALAFETSQLKVRGDTEADRSLKFLKPSVTLDWKGKKGWHVQAVLRREAAQLDFYDFISSAELANDRVNGGNADLLPQTSWEARLTIERPVLGQGLIKLELGHDWVSQLQDRILTDEGFDAPGNIGSGKRKFARATFDAPLDKLGLKATRLKFEGTLQETSVRDPLSGTNRAWSGFWPKWDYELELRRDLGKWSYGATLFDRAPFSFFRTDEIDSNFNSQPFAIGFVEFRPDKQTTMRFDVDNAIDTRGQRFRQFFDPNRTAAQPTVNEFRDRNSHVAVTFSVNRTFGGSGAG